MRKPLSLIFVCLLIGISSFTYANTIPDDGWSWIQRNNFKEAKDAFLKTLEKDPKNEDALCGLIFLAETLQDYDGYKAHIKTLIESKWDEKYVELFKHIYDGDPADIIKKDLPEYLIMTARANHADSLFERKKFKESSKLLAENVGDYNWSIIGPFVNVAGSGHIEEHSINEEPFSPNKMYTNESGIELKWINRKVRAPYGGLVYTSILPSSNEGSYFANTFFDFSKDETLQIRIARNTPMKIWLDDELVFDRNYNITYRWDAEIVELKIKAGTHRLLVKSSPYFEAASKSSIDLDYNDRSDNGDGFNSYYDDYDYGGFQSSGYRNNNSSPRFSIRLTDTNGKLLQDVKTNFNGTYNATSYAPTIREKKLINNLRQRIESSPDDLKNYYLLCKAYALYNLNEEGEKIFKKILEAHEDEIYFKYLMAKFYAVNDKGEKAEELISSVNEEEIPIFPMMSNELDKIDMEKNEEEYLSVLEKLLNVSPTNWSIINRYLSYYGKKGKTEEKKTFIQTFMAKHKDEKYKERLEPYLEDDSYKPSSYKPMTDKERDKEAKEAQKNIKKRFRFSDYYTVISALKRKEKFDDVFKLYDELIRLKPYQINAMERKAELLFEKDRLDEALVTLNQILEIRPYNKDALEQIGDIYFEKDDKDVALEYYKKARKISLQGNSYYGSDGLDKKIEKIKNKKSYKEFFNSISFEDALKDEGWKEKYKEEESVVLLYSIEAALNKENMMDYNQKMMIYIQNKAGATFWTEANFGFIGNISFVKVLKKDGRVTSPNRNYNYVVFKNLEPGDIIQIEGNSSANMTQELPDEMFHISAVSYDVPVRHAKYEFILPKGKYIDYECNRIDCTAKKRTDAEYDIYEWEYWDVPKVEREDAILDNLDSYAWMMFSTLKDWGDVVKWYLRKTYRRLETNYEIEETLKTIVTDEMDEEEKVKSIYNYLTKEITYSHVSFLNSNYIPKKPSETISAEIGDCKDVASLMISMLRAVGIESYYVLVRTSNYSNIEPRPTNLTFNHVIVGYVLKDGKMRYMDMTTDYYPHYVIPEFDGNAWALLVKEGEKDIFRLPNDLLDPSKSKMDVTIKAKVNTDRSLSMDADVNLSGVIGGKVRESLNRITTEADRRKYLTEYFGSGAFDHLVLNDFSFENLEDITIPLSSSFDMKAYNHVEKVSSFYIIQVPIFKPISTSPTLFVDKRYNNLDLLALFETAPNFQKIDLEIPSTFTLMEMPQNVKIDNEFASYELRFNKTAKGFQIERELVFKNRLVENKDYQKFKDFYMQILDADRTKLAIKKR